MQINIERYRSYIVNSGVYLLAALIPSVISVLINPLMAMNLSPTDYAIVSYYTSFNSLFTPIIGFFFTDFFIRRYYKLDKEKLYRLKGNIIKLLLYFSGIASVLCLLGLFVFVKVTNVEFNFFPYALLAILSLFFSYIYNLQLAEYKIAGDSKSYFNVSVVWGTVMPVLSVLMVVVLKWGAEGKLLASMIGSLLPFIWCLHKDKEYLNVPFDKELIRQIFIFAYPLVLAAMLNFVSSGYDKVLLERQKNPVSFGYYAVACQMSGYVTIFSNAVKSTFQPDMFKAIAQKSYRKVLAVMGICIGVVLAITVLYIAFCPIIIDLLTAGRYVESTTLSQITALSVVTSTIYFQISQFTYGVGLTKITLLNKIIGSVITIGLLAVLINNYNVTGAAWGMVLSYLVFALGNVILLFVNRKHIFAE